MRTKIRDWLMSIDDKNIERFADYLAKLIEIGFYLLVGYSISKW